MVDVKNGEEFVGWLKSRTREERALIAGRAAMRVVPVVLSWLDLTDIVLPLYRGSATALVVGTYPTAIVCRQLAASAADNASYAARRAASAAAYATDVARATDAAASAAAHAARAAAYDHYGYAHFAYDDAARAYAAIYAVHTIRMDDAANAAARSDIDWLESGRDVADLSAHPIWPNAEPEVLTRRRAEFAKDLLARNEHWDVWLDWIEAMHRGGPRFQDAAFAKAIDTLDLWNGTPAEVNLRIKQLVEEERARQTPPELPEIPEIPPQKPATIMPNWEDGRLVWHDDPAAPDLSPADFDEAFAALRTDLLDLAEEAVGENFDRRLPDFIRRIAGKVPNSNSPQSALFSFGHQYPALLKYGERVNKEASDTFAASYHGVVLQMDGVLRQVAVWREFEANRLKDTLQPGESEKIAELGRITAEELRSEEAKAFVGQNIPAAIKGMAEELAETLADIERSIAIHGSALAYDLLSSIGNVLKRLAEKALSLAKWGADFAKDVGAEIRKEAIKKIASGFVGLLTKLIEYPALWELVRLKMPWLPSVFEIAKEILRLFVGA